jgi:HEPN domain-containing protein
MKDNKKLIDYWIKTARHDYDTMLSLFNSKRYSDSLFYGHLVLEKILKALIAKRMKEHPKPTHNLLVLLEDSNVQLSPEDKEFLAEANKFNIKARYPDYKLSFYRICNLYYTRPRLEKIKLLFNKLCQLL